MDQARGMLKPLHLGLELHQAPDLGAVDAE